MVGMHVPSPRRLSLFSAVRGHRIVAVGLAVVTVAALASGCGSSDSSNPDVPTVTPATAAPAPPGSAVSPVGTVVPTPADGRDLAVDDGVVVVLDAAGTTVRGYESSALAAAPRLITTPPLTRIIGTGGGTFLGVGPNVIVRIARDGAVTSSQVSVDDPTALAYTDSGEVLVGTGNGHVLVFDSALEPVRDIGGFVRVDDITVSPPGADLPGEQVVVLDRAQSSVTQLNVSEGDLGLSLRAGNGATNSVVDRYGRILVANTRDDEFIGFFGSPLVMRFRYPVGNGPFAVDYDDTRNLAWVSTTANNEVVAYDLSGGEPVEKYRFPTVAQPDNIAVDDATGRLLVLSARGGLEAVAPGDAAEGGPPAGG